MKKILIITSLVVLLAAPLLGLTACGQSLTEKDIETIRGLIARVDSLESKTASNTNKLANLSPISDEDISQAKSDIAAIKTDIASLKTKDSETNTDMTALLTQITELESKIEALEAWQEELEEEPTSSSDKDAITCELEVWGGNTIPSGSTSLDEAFKITVENNSAYDVEDVVFTFTFDTRYNLVNMRNIDLTGGGTIWREVGSGGSYIVFENSWGFDVDANSKERFILELNIDFDATTQSNRFEVDIFVEDYDFA